MVYKKKDPKKHSRKIEFIDDEPRDESIKLYSHVKDGGKYIYDWEEWEIDNSRVFSPKTLSKPK